MDSNQTANVNLTANTGQYQQSMDAANASTQKVLSSVVALSTALGKLTTSAGRKLEVIGLGQIAALAAATASAAKFQQQMAQLHAQSTLTNQDFSVMSKAVNSLRTNFAVSTTEAVQLATQLSKMGQSQGQIRQLGETFIRLGAVTGESISGLVDGLISLQRSMGVTGADYTQRFASALAQVSAKAGTSATSVLQFSNAIAPIARVAGISTNEVLGISAAFSKAGQDGYAAATAFSGIMTDITRATAYGSPELSKYANLLGVTVEQFKKMPAATQFTDFIEAINKQGPQAIKTLDALGLDGTRTMRAIQGLAQSGGLQSAISQTASGYSNTLPFNQASDQALKGLNDELERMGNIASRIATAIGDGLVPPITMLIKTLNAVLSPVANLIELFGRIPGLTLAGAAGITLLAGVALASFTKLAGLGLGATVLRGPLGGGLLAGMGMTGGRFGNFASRAQSTYDAGGGGMFQRALFAGGNLLGRGVQTVRGLGTGEGLTVGERMSRVAGMGAQGISKFMQYSMEPLYAQNLMNPMNRTPFFTSPSFTPIKDVRAAGSRVGAALRDAWSGGAATGDHMTGAEGATKGLAKFGSALERQSGLFRSLGTASLGLMTSIGKASVGIAAAGGVAGGGLALRAGGALASFASANPLLVGGAAAYGAYSMFKNAGKQSDEVLNNTDTSFGPAKAYTTSLGIAAAATKTFADVVAANTKKISGLTDQNYSKLNPQQAAAYASLQLQGADPKTRAGIRADLKTRFGDKSAGIFTSAESGNVNIGSLLGSGSALGIDPRTLSLGIQAGTSARQGSQLDTNRYQISQLNQLVTGSTQPTPAGGLTGGMVLQTKSHVAEAIVNQMLPEGQRDAASVDAVEQALIQAKNDPAKFRQVMLKSSTAAGRAFKTAVSGANAGAGFDLNATNFIPSPVAAANTPFQGLSQAMLTNLRQSSPAAAGAFDINTGAGKLIAAGTVSGQADPNALAKGAIAMSDSFTKTTGSLSGTIAELEKLKVAINDTTNATYQQAEAAQQHTELLQQQQAPYQTLAQRLGQARTNYQLAQTNAANAPPGPGEGADTQAQLQQRQTELNAVATESFQYTKQLAMATREFDVQLSRSQADFALSRAHSEEDYSRMRKRSLRDFGIAQKQQLQDFALSRQRQEEDFNHSLVLMAQTTSQQVYDVYQRITVKQSWDAQNLLQNLRDQQEALTGQLNNLQTIRGAGVSSNVIKLLGLDQSANAQQLARFVSDITNNPALVKALNDQAAKRLKSAKKLATDSDNEQFQEMQYQFNQSLRRSQNDFDKASRRQTASFQRSLNDQASDFAIGMQRMAEQNRLQMQRAHEDFNRAVTDLGSDMAKLAKLAASQLSGAAASQFRIMLSQASTASAALLAIVSKTATAMARDPGATGSGAGGKGGRGSSGMLPAHLSGNQAIVNKYAAARGWGSGAEWSALVNVINGESGFRNTAQNPTSTAYGIFQFLDSTWGTVGGHKTSDPAWQSVYGMRYIAQRYGDPINAWAFKQKHGWYGAGGVFNGPQQIGVGEKGAETVLPLNEAGSDFMVNVMKKYLTAARAAMVTGNSQTMHSKNIVYNIKSDHSTNYNGGIKVFSADPMEFERKMEAKQRLQRLGGHRSG